MNKTDLKYICSIKESDGKDRFLMTHALGFDYEDDFVFDTRHGIVEGEEPDDDSTLYL